MYLKLSWSKCRRVTDIFSSWKLLWDKSSNDENVTLRVICSLAVNLSCRASTTSPKEVILSQLTSTLLKSCLRHVQGEISFRTAQWRVDPTVKPKIVYNKVDIIQFTYIKQKIHTTLPFKGPSKKFLLSVSKEQLHLHPLSKNKSLQLMSKVVPRKKH